MQLCMYIVDFEVRSVHDFISSNHLRGYELCSEVGGTMAGYVKLDGDFV